MSTDTKMFRGWPAEALEFYEGLEADNSKAYWTAHKDVHETVVLSDEGDPCRIGPRVRRRQGIPSQSGRPLQYHKSPYKTHIGATIGASYRDGRLTGRSRRRPSRKVSTFSL